MIWKPIAAAALAAVLLGATHRPAPSLVYSAPAANRPAGADAIHPTTAILPDGRIAAPAGVSAFVGTNPLGLTLTPDGRFAIVSNDDERTAGASPRADSPLVPGFSLAVVDTRTMKLTSTYRDPSSAFFIGVAAVAEAGGTIVLASDGPHGVVRVFDLAGDGRLTPEARTIALPAGGTRHAFPAGIAVSGGGTVAYVADNFNGTVVAIDVAARAVTRSFPAGNFPLDVAAAGRHVLVSAGGLAAYAPLDPPVRFPQFAAPAFDPNRSSALDVLSVLADGSATADPDVVRMDPAPDGTKIVGGAAPGAIALRRDGRLAYVALANVDRVAVVSLGSGTPHVVRGLDLRLYPNAPYGAQPTAEALGKDGKRLFVALAGLNAVAVLDARSPARYRYGLIPTGWYPTALALSPNGRYLYVVSAKGVDGWGMLSRVDLKHTSLVKATMNALRYNRTASIAKQNALVPPLRSGKRSSAIERIVYVAVGRTPYDGVLGDLTGVTGAALGNGDASLAQYPQSVTPNLHALARTFGLADNFYAGDADLAIARSYATQAGATSYAQLTARLRSSRAPFDGSDDPEDYGRDGYLFNELARAGESYRDYGGLLHLSGYAAGRYRLDVPALAALGASVDPAYPGDDPSVDDAQRAQEFVRDMKPFAQAGRLPDYTYVWLPTQAGPAGAGDADRALGTIVDFLSHTPQWPSMAIFVAGEGVDSGGDHVNPLRSYCIVVSPYARHGYVGSAHLSVPSVVKTEEELLGLPPLTLGDLLATDMADFFTDASSPEPYRAAR